ncbi:MAG: hypothetical protein H0V66_14425 [Bdellovibrionales bacterium]|nr:hypothetical protein [Bdellovibrionales bacterium]
MFKYLFLILVSLNAFAHDLKLTTDIYSNEEEIFYSHQGEGRFDSTLAMSIKYAPIKNLKTQLEAYLGKPLDFFKLWNESGEAHVTVVGPLEFYDVLKSKMTMTEIEKIADRYEIQNSHLMILGMGSAKRLVNGKEEETYFVIVDSSELREIRQQIFYEFTRRGGDRAAFDPTWFFPHITVGYTLRDFHESDGILKNLKYSLDKRFNLLFR